MEQYLVRFDGESITIEDSLGIPPSIEALFAIYKHTGLIVKNSDKAIINYVKEHRKIAKDVFNKYLEDSPAKKNPYLKKYVYLAKDLETGNLKIGISKDPIQRIRTLNTGSGSNIVLVETIPSLGEKPYLTIMNEMELHRRFSEYHIKGEWFMHHDSIINFFTENK